MFYACLVPQRRRIYWGLTAQTQRPEGLQKRIARLLKSICLEWSDHLVGSYLIDMQGQILKFARSDPKIRR
jgi:hypothetical protein